MSDGYAFVPLTSQVRRAPRPHAVHDRRAPGTLTGALTLVLRAEQPVHVGSGEKGLEGNRIVRRGARVLGAPGVPGASFKGALRSRYEAITQSCARERPLKEQKEFNSSTYGRIKRVTLSEHFEGRHVFQSCGRDDPACAACALFGRLSLRSRVTIVDLVADSPEFAFHRTPEPFMPRLHHVGDYRVLDERPGSVHLEVHRLRGRKFAIGRGPVPEKASYQHVEAIPEGARLQGTLRFVNLLPEELGGLITALGLQPRSALKLGGGKGQGFGRVVIERLTASVRDHRGQSVRQDEAAWRSAFELSPDRFPEGEAALVAIHQGDC